MRTDELTMRQFLDQVLMNHPFSQVAHLIETLEGEVEGSRVHVLKTTEHPGSKPLFYMLMDKRSADAVMALIGIARIMPPPGGPVGRDLPFADPAPLPEGSVA